MKNPSLSTSDFDLQSDVEKELDVGNLNARRLSPGEIEERREEQREVEGFANTQAVPGVPLDENEFQEQGLPEESDPQGRVSRVVSRVLSRTSIKSVPSPPPDGGLMAWTVGMTRLKAECISNLHSPRSAAWSCHTR